MPKVNVIACGSLHTYQPKYSCSIRINLSTVGCKILCTDMMVLPYTYLSHNQMSIKHFHGEFVQSVNVDCRINMLDLFLSKIRIFFPRRCLFLCLYLHLIFVARFHVVPFHSVLHRQKIFRNGMIYSHFKSYGCFGGADGVYGRIFYSMIYLFMLFNHQNKIKRCFYSFTTDTQQTHFFSCIFK